jgi:hypothetical protein
MTTTVIEEWFERARTHAAQGNLVVVRADGQCLLLPALARASAKPEIVAAMERMIPPTAKRNVAAIADIMWANNGSPSIQAANEAIPFFGILMGLTCIGHSVWVFHGAADFLSAGCRDSDAMIVDSDSLKQLPRDWRTKALKSMRNPQILIHDRATYSLRIPA